MRIIEKNVKWIMLVSGMLTSTMVYAAIAPEAALMSTFGESVSGPVAEIVVRNWGVLITLIGAELIYGAFNAQHRNLILVFATLSKLVFIGLVLTIGRQYLSIAGVAIAFDAIIVTLFILYLFTNRYPSSNLH